MTLEDDKIKLFTDLIAWQEGHKLVVAIYGETKNFPKEEIFGITNQMRGSAISVTSNITEGFSRTTYKDKLQFYVIAQGSLTELQNQLIASRDIDYLSNMIFQEIFNQTVTVHKLINGLIKKCKSLIHNT